LWLFEKLIPAQSALPAWPFAEAKNPSNEANSRLRFKFPVTVISGEMYSGEVDMTDESYKTADLWLKVGGALGLIIGAAAGVGEYIVTTSQQSTLETNKFGADQSKLLFEQQTSLYFKASQLAATVAVIPDGPDRAKAEIEFKELYYGPMVIVEDRNDAPPANGGQKARRRTGEVRQ